MLMTQPLDATEQQGDRNFDRRKMSGRQRVELWLQIDDMKSRYSHMPQYKLAEFIVFRLEEQGVHTSVEVVRRILKGKVIRLG